jgi:hypothetical protein
VVRKDKTRERGQNKRAEKGTPRIISSAGRWQKTTEHFAAADLAASPACRNMTVPQAAKQQSVVFGLSSAAGITSLLPWCDGRRRKACSPSLALNS